MTSHSNTYYTTKWLPMFSKILTIFLKGQSFPFTLVQSVRSDRNEDVGH